MPDQILLTPVRVCSECEARLGYSHKDGCSFGDWAVVYSDTVEKFTTVEDAQRDDGPMLAISLALFRQIVFEAGGAVSAVFLREQPDKVMPSEEVSAAVDAVLDSFGLGEEPQVDSSNSSLENDDLAERNAAAIERLGNSVEGESLPQLTTDEARALHAVYAGDAFDAEHLETAQPKLEAIAGESWR